MVEHAEHVIIMFKLHDLILGIWHLDARLNHHHRIITIAYFRAFYLILILDL